MNASDLLLDQWEHQVKELFPTLHSFQQDTLAFIVQSLIQSGNAVMQRVAETAWEYLGSQTKMVSHERRLQRFVANERIEVDGCWKHFLETTLPVWHNKPMKLVLDMTPYSKHATIVYVGLVVHARALPIAWCIMPQQEHWKQGQWDIVARLFAQVAAVLPSSDCTLLADRGLSCLHLIKQCQQVGWHYVLRIKNEEWVRRKFRHVYRDWEQGKHFVKKEGEHWYGKVLLWQSHQFESWLSACWDPGYDEGCHTECCVIVFCEKALKPFQS